MGLAEISPSSTSHRKNCQAAIANGGGGRTPMDEQVLDVGLDMLPPDRTHFRGHAWAVRKAASRVAASA